MPSPCSACLIFLSGCVCLSRALSLVVSPGLSSSPPLLSLPSWTLGVWPGLCILKLQVLLCKLVLKLPVPASVCLDFAPLSPIPFSVSVP